MHAQLVRKEHIRDFFFRHADGAERCQEDGPSRGTCRKVVCMYLSLVQHSSCFMGQEFYKEKISFKALREERFLAMADKEGISKKKVQAKLDSAKA